MTEKVGFNAMARKLYSYERFSFTTQEAGDSQARQTEAIEQAAKEEGLPIDDSLRVKDKAMSAFRGKHWRKGNLGKFLDLVEGKVIPPGSVLVIERVSRLSREPWLDALKLWERILRAGIVIRTCSPSARITIDNVNDLSINTPLSVAITLAYEESRQKSEMIGAAMRRRLDEAKASGKPHGLRCPGWIRPISHPHPLDKNRKVVTDWELIGDRVAIILRIHQLARDGASITEILRTLERLEVSHWRKDGRWTRQAIVNLLRSRAVLGERVKEDRNFLRLSASRKGWKAYPAIMSEQEYDDTQRALTMRRRGAGRKAKRMLNLFTGMVKDLEGNPLSLRYSTGRGGKKHAYLADQQARNAASYEQVQTAILQSLRKVQPTDIDGSARTDPHLKELESVHSDLAKKQQTLDALDRQLRELPADCWPDRVVSHMSELETEIRKLQKRLQYLNEQSNTTTRVQSLSATQSLIDYLDGLPDGDEKQSVLERLKIRIGILIEGITLATDGVVKRSKWIHLRIAFRGGYVERLSWRIGNPGAMSSQFNSGW